MPPVSLTLWIANLAEIDGLLAVSPAAFSRLPLEDVRIPELDLRRPESRKFSLNQGQQLLAAWIILHLQEERTVFFQLAKLPPDAEFLKHRAYSWAGFDCDDSWPATLVWPLTNQGCFICRNKVAPFSIFLSLGKPFPVAPSGLLIKLTWAETELVACEGGNGEKPYRGDACRLTPANTDVSVETPLI